MEIVEGERGGDGHLFWIMLLVGVGLNSSSWKLLLQGQLELNSSGIHAGS